MSLKKVHEEGFLVFDTIIGDVTIALPDADSADAFRVASEDNDDGLTEILTIDFKTDD